MRSLKARVAKLEKTMTYTCPDCMETFPDAAHAFGHICEKKKLPPRPPIYPHFSLPVSCPDRTAQDRLPRAVGESVFFVFGVGVRCYVLETGGRIIHAGDLAMLLQAMGQPFPGPAGEMVELLSWCRGEW